MSDAAFRGETEEQRDPLEPVGSRRCPKLEWTDDEGAHRIEVERRSVLGAAPHVDVVVADVLCPACTRRWSLAPTGSGFET